MASFNVTSKEQVSGAVCIPVRKLPRSALDELESEERAGSADSMRWTRRVQESQKRLHTTDGQADHDNASLEERHATKISESNQGCCPVWTSCCDTTETGQRPCMDINA